jgi:pyruvate,water dikinase
MAATYTLRLDDPLATLETAGGKGASLARMSAAGLPVPGGFHVTTAAYWRFVDDNAIQPGILAALAGVDLANPDALEAASTAICGLFDRGAFPADVAADVAGAYAGLEGAAVAVRSSATAEDLPEASFAGQQETFLNVRGADAVLEAVKRCWASLWTARAISYRARQGTSPDSVALAVVVQAQVPAEAAGILFTANPVTGDRGQAVISAAWGLGEAVVGGLVTPDTLTVDKTSGRVLDRQTADKQVMTVRTGAGVEEQPVPDALRRAPVLGDHAAAELTRLAVRVEALYGMPMDVEWALAGGEIAILQARPVTALPELAPPIRWTLPDPKMWYARGSLCEHLPDPVSPLFATMGMRLANVATDELMRSMTNDRIDYGYAVINGYLYLGTRLGWREIWIYLKMSARVMGAMFRGGAARWLKAGQRLQSVVGAWEARPVEALTPDGLLAGARELFLETVRYYTVIQAGVLPIATSSEIVFNRVYKLAGRAGDPDAAFLLYGFDTAPIQAEKALYDLAQWVAARPALKAYVLTTPNEALLAGMQASVRSGGFSSSGDPTAEAVTTSAALPDDLPEWRARFQAYLAEFGRTVYEFDFAYPTPAEAPEPMLETIRMYLAGHGVNPHERQRLAAERREQATVRVLAHARWPFRGLLRRTLGWAQHSGPVREDSLAGLGMAHRQIRRLLGELGWRLAAGGAIANAEEIYWLEETEVEELVTRHQNGDPLPALGDRVLRRKEEKRVQSKLIAPAILPETSRLAKIMPWSEQRQGEENMLKGTGASAGKVTAPACVLHGPEDFASMKPGQVLVAVTTTPAWTPLFAMASAVVTDIGGPLSHSSIVAREYGIPAVMATGLATRRIHSGQMITVDGSAGVVLLSNGHEP